MKTIYTCLVVVSASAPLVSSCRFAQDGEPDAEQTTVVGSGPSTSDATTPPPERLPPSDSPVANRTVLETNLPSSLAPIVDGQFKAFVDAPTAASRRFDTVAVGIVTSDKSYFKGYKNAQKLGPQPSADSLFEMGPSAKLVTALGVLELIQAGKITLETPAKDVLPDMVLPTYQGEPIRIRHLLAHTSGLPRAPIDISPGQSPFADYTEDRLKSYLAGMTLAMKPDTVWEESDIGYGLLGLITAKLQNAAFEPAIKSLVTKKIGMTDATIKLSTSQDSRLLRGFNNGVPLSLTTYSEAFAGAGALRASMRDMARLVQAQLGLIETPLAESIKKSQETLYSGADAVCAAGWGLRSHKGYNILLMKGSMPGATSLIAFSLDKKVGVVVLTNNAFSENGVADPRVEDAGLEVLVQILSMN